MFASAEEKRRLLAEEVPNGPDAYISRLVASGANIKVARQLARHSTPTLTLGRYAHVQPADQTRALDALPAIESTGAEREAAAATGTDDATPDPTDGQPARSAFAARRLPGTPLPAKTGCQVTRGAGGAHVAHVSPLGKTCHYLTMARPGGFEPPTFGFEVRDSIR